MERTIREFTGEIWSEITIRQLDNSFSYLKELDAKTVNELLDVIGGVLARYSGYIVANDMDFPVVPLPHNKQEKSEES